MNILFTCAGRRTYLLKYFRENMSEGDLIVATDMQLSAPALQAADVRIQVPGVYDPDYIEILLGICREQKIDALFSLNDLELPILAHNKSKFEKIGVRVVVSDPQVIDIAFDKYSATCWIESLGLKTPKTFLSLEGCFRALAAGQVEFPLFLKPRWGSGSIGLELAEDEEELKVYYNMLMKKIKRTILARASVGSEYILIQETLTGPEYGLDIMNDLEGNYVGTCVKRKLAMRSGETDKAEMCNIPELEEMGRLIGQNLKHVGNLDVDVMQRADGEFCVLELNPRFGGGFPFSYEAGVNLPKAMIQWIKGEKVDAGLLKPEYGKVFAKNDYLVEIRK